MRASIFLLLLLGILLPFAVIGPTSAQGDSRSRDYSQLFLRALFTEGIRNLNGVGNNLGHPTWGMANTPYARTAPTTYTDGKSAIVDGPDPRYVSNRVFNDVNQNVFSENGVTQWAWTWGQFMDHTFGLAQSGTESATIPYDASDPLEDFTNDAGSIGFTRDAAAPGTGVIKPRQQINTIASYIDAWDVYGGSNTRLEWLREGPVDGNMANNGAHLLLTPDGFLPRVTERGDPGAAPTMALMGRLMGEPDKAVVAGDVRANENIALTAVQTLFAREHNRIVDALPKRLPEEFKFQVARAVVIAEEQYITYTQWLPDLGIQLDKYKGYNRNVNPSLSNEFATAAYRAHSMIHGEFEMDADADRYTAEQVEAFEDNGIEVEPNGGEVEVVVPLNVAFGNPDLVPEIGLGEILAGLGAESQYKNDEMIDNQLRSVMFQIPGAGSSDCLDGPTLPNCFNMVQDLGAIDLARDRDHGIATYNQLRKAYGLKPVTSFAQITGETTEAFPNDPEITGNPIDDPSILDFVQLKDSSGNVLPAGTEEGATSAVRRTSLASRLKAIYGDINKVDAFVGMLSEKHVPGTEFGPTQMTIWKAQFQALRDGDRYFYKNYGVLRYIKQIFGISYEHSLGDIIQMNTDIGPGEISGDVFKPSGGSSVSAAPLSAGDGGATPSSAPARDFIAAVADVNLDLGAMRRRVGV